jgi:hypothetical protein
VIKNILIIFRGSLVERQMSLLLKIAMIGAAQLSSFIVVGQDNYGDPSAPLLLPSNSGK